MLGSVVYPQRKEEEALAAPKDPAHVRLQSIVILIVAIMSVLGAGWIMLSYAVFPNLRSFRHRLILGLAISDFLMALNFISSTSLNIAHRYINAPYNARFCNFNGFIAQVFVIQTDYWVLTIAVCTYFILAGHKRPSTWVQNHECIILLIPWFFSSLWAFIGLGVVGYEDIGAWCWFKSDLVRLLVNFIPRWIIIVTMFVLYAYLYVVLYKAHDRLRSVTATPDGPSSITATPNVSQVSSLRDDTGGRSLVSLRRLKRIARLMLLYPLAYAVIWSLPTAIRIYQATEKESAAFALQTVDKASVVIQGFVDAVIYGINETSLSSWRALLSRRTYPLAEEWGRREAFSPSPGNERAGAPWSNEIGRLEPAVSSSSQSGSRERDRPPGTIELRELGNDATRM
ncbi:G-protein coupled receptor 1 [Colletotrichum musicola]|uniref:G-protein coupled receptor 1 n=1 Tax=Colletotrichum musicola TaxID=2175873 RepID=A0A8H6NVW3_9PEZI|nr:G-protein coupled receptor 1 [Colletotrichum musicola]